MIPSSEAAGFYFSDDRAQRLHENGLRKAISQLLSGGQDDRMGGEPHRSPETRSEQG